jgi:1-acyl-sn-glycerol-3-phosphate acyltransferase
LLIGAEESLTASLTQKFDRSFREVFKLMTAMLTSSHTPMETMPSQPITTINSRFSPWLLPLSYFLCQLILPLFFKRIEIIGQENLPHENSVVLAPTHRSRWDGILIAFATGRLVTGRDMHFMVTQDEAKGFQGWILERLGGFPINPKNPSIASLRHGIKVLQERGMMVVFPEGNIFRTKEINPLKPGLIRLALQAESSDPDLGVKVVPITLSYSHKVPRWGCEVTIRIGKPIEVAQYQQSSAKQNAKLLAADLTKALEGLSAIEGDEEGVLSLVSQS